MSCLDRIAAHVALWALNRLYGAGCETDARDDFPNDPELWDCHGCDARRMQVHLRGLLE